MCLLFMVPGLFIIFSHFHDRPPYPSHGIFEAPDVKFCELLSVRVTGYPCTVTRRPGRNVDWPGDGWVSNPGPPPATDKTWPCVLCFPCYDSESHGP